MFTILITNKTSNIDKISSILNSSPIKCSVIAVGDDNINDILMGIEGDVVILDGVNVNKHFLTSLSSNYDPRVLNLLRTDVIKDVVIRDRRIGKTIQKTDITLNVAFNTSKINNIGNIYEYCTISNVPIIFKPNIITFKDHNMIRHRKTHPMTDIPKLSDIRKIPIKKKNTKKDLKYSIIIPFMYNGDRFPLFEASIQCLHKHFKRNANVDIIVHETAPEQHLSKEFIKKYNIKYIFSEWDRIFHRAWALNVPAKYVSDSDIFIFFDADLLVTDEWVEELLNMDTSKVYIGWGTMYNLSSTATDSYIQDNVLIDNYERIRKPGSLAAAGGINIIPRDIFFDIDGWDESFIDTYGGEDNALSLKLHALGIAKMNENFFQSAVYHLYHGHITHRDPKRMDIFAKLRQYDKNAWLNHMNKTDFGVPIQKSTVWSHIKESLIKSDKIEDNYNQIDINFFWSGDKFDYINLLTIQSHIRVGHNVIIHLHGDIPKSIYWDRISTLVTIKNADNIINISAFMDAGGNFRTASSLWRFKFLYEYGGWYSDCDAIALKKWDINAEWVLCSDNRKDISTGVIKAPKKQKMFLDMIKGIKKNWGNIGVFNSVYKEYMGNNDSTIPDNEFYPFSWKEYDELLTGKDVPDTYSVHAYNTMLERNNLITNIEQWLHDNPNTMLGKINASVMNNQYKSDTGDRLKILWCKIDTSRRIAGHFDHLLNELKMIADVDVIHQDLNGTHPFTYQKGRVDQTIQPPSIIKNPEKYDAIVIANIFAYSEDWEYIRSKTPIFALFEDQHNDARWHLEYAIKHHFILLHRYQLKSFNNDINYKIRNNIWFPHSVNTDIFADYDQPKTYDILSIGATYNVYQTRNFVNNHFKASPYKGFKYIPRPIELTANPWPVGVDYAKEINKSWLTICCGSTLKYPVMKYFEIPASGSVIYGDYFDELGDLGFEPDKNMIVLDKANMMQQVKSLLQNKDKLREIIYNGQQLVSQKHTTDIRAKELINIMRKFNV